MAGVKGRSGRKPGGPKTGGRKKGTPNKLSGDVKEMILGALAAKGGQEYLERQAEANPTAFLTLVGKLVPLSVGGEDGGPVRIETVVTWAGLSAGS